MENKVAFLEMFLSLYMNHFEVMKLQKGNPEKIELIDIRNAPKALKIDKIAGSLEIPAREITERLGELDKNKIYVVYDWNGGTVLGKQALKILLENGFEAYELAGALEGWKAMGLPMELVG